MGVTKGATCGMHGFLAVTQDAPVRLAVVGCGAAAQHLHLPALAGRRDCDVAVLVDPLEQQAARLAREYGVPRVLTDHRQLTGLDVEAAVLTAPNDLHAAIAVDLAQAGIDVLVEKPVARCVDEAEAMRKAADEAGRILAVGMVLRFSAANQAARDFISSGMLGPISSFTAISGVEYAWPVATPYILHAAQAGGGALIDIGIHALDLLLWWLGDVDCFDYRDDYYGGVEADCLLDLTMASGAVGTVEVSRTRDLEQTITVQGEHASLRVGFVDGLLELSTPDGAVLSGVPGRDPSGWRADLVDFIIAEHDDFLSAVRSRRPPMVDVREALRSLALVESCYGQRRLWELPWVAPAGDRP